MEAIIRNAEAIAPVRALNTILQDAGLGEQAQRWRHQAREMNLKLYIWEGVLSDYTDGMVAALAENEEQAWEKLKEKDSTAYFSLRGQYQDEKQETPEPNRPREITAPEAFTCWGGG